MLTNVVHLVRIHTRAYGSLFFAFVCWRKFVMSALWPKGPAKQHLISVVLSIFVGTMGPVQGVEIYFSDEWSRDSCPIRLPKINTVCPTKPIRPPQSQFGQRICSPRPFAFTNMLKHCQWNHFRYRTKKINNGYAGSIRKAAAQVCRSSNSGWLFTKRVPPSTIPEKCQKRFAHEDRFIFSNFDLPRDFQSSIPKKKHPHWIFCY